jgi:hypothetical protein
VGGQSSGSVVIDFDEFLCILGLCGHIKYEEIEKMDLATRVKSIYLNYLVKADEQKVISDCLYPPPPRFDPKSVQLPEKLASRILDTWGKMDFSHVFGFPIFEEVVFKGIAGSYEELTSIFTYYAKSGTAGATSADQAMTIQATELGNLALDLGILTESFNMTRIVNIYRRADQVDDTIKKSASDHRVEIGEDAKGGDRGLEFHEFLELLMRVSFQRLNPKYGSVGNRDCSHGKYPECLEKMLAEKVIGKAQSLGVLGTEEPGAIEISDEDQLGALLLALVLAAKSKGLDAERALRESVRELEVEIRQFELSDDFDAGVIGK